MMIKFRRTNVTVNVLTVECNLIDINLMPVLLYKCEVLCVFTDACLPHSGSHSDHRHPGV